MKNGPLEDGGGAGQPSGHHQRHQQHQHQGQDPHRQFYADMARSATSLFNTTHPNEQSTAGPLAPAPSGSTPESYSPVVSVASGKPQVLQTAPQWPSREVTDDTIDDAYAQFILCCNPTIAADCDTAELRKAFRMPPKSDGNTFSTFRLLQLIGKFEQNEIKTWTKLAVELGVERKDDQSTQKVQQYAVRLKRWMHAMHIDAFFEYCLNKPHIYYTNIPHEAPNSTEYIRDGVPLEEDLALRALQPESRPKRGRRKTEDKPADDGFDDDPRAPKRPQLELTTTGPMVSDHYGSHNHHHHPHIHSQYHHAHNPMMHHTPQSALSNGVEHDIERYLDPVTPDQWSAATAAALSASVSSAGGINSATPGGQQFRWRAFPRDGSSHPRSATDIVPPPQREDHQMVTPITPPIATPISATAAKSRPRRRHGPAVSSAWPSTGNSSSGKLRGRPPTNRSVRDGPFSTFPANPQGKQGPSIDLTSINYPNSTPTPVTNLTNHYSFTRPATLHLQVPGRMSISSSTGGLDPQHQLNGNVLSEQPADKHLSFDKPTIHSRLEPHQFVIQGPATFPSSLTIDSIERQFAAQILFSCGDDPNMTSDKAKIIASSVIAELRKSRNIAEDETLLARNAAVLLGCDGMHITDMYVNKIEHPFGDDEEVAEQVAHISESQRSSVHRHTHGSEEIDSEQNNNGVGKTSEQAQERNSDISEENALDRIIGDTVEDDLLPDNHQSDIRHASHEVHERSPAIDPNITRGDEGNGINGIANDKASSVLATGDTIEQRHIETDPDLSPPPTLEEYALEWVLSLGMITVNCSARVTVNTSIPPATLTLQDEVEKLFSGMDGTEALTAAAAAAAGSSHITIEEDDGQGAPETGTETNGGATSDSEMGWKEKYLQCQEDLKRSRNETERLKKGILEQVMSVGSSR